MRWLSTALLVALAGCQNADSSDEPEGNTTAPGSDRATPAGDTVAADEVLAQGVPADDVDGVPSGDGSEPPSRDGSEVINDPVVQEYLNRSPAYRSYRAYVERQKQAAQAASATESELPEASAGELSESELFEGDFSEATIANFVLPPGHDTLAMYANRCDAATGIHVPEFNCNLGTEIPQGKVQSTLTIADIGMTGGYRAVNANEPTTNILGSAGADIWNNTDSFFFAYTSDLGGGNPDGSPGGVDGYAEVLVTGLSNTHAFAKAGIMFRTSTAPGSVNVTLAITPTSGAMIQKRTSPNGTSTNEILPGRAVPTWLRLLRRSNTFTGFVSVDRVTWTQVGNPVTLTGFTTNPLIGLAVSSHVAGVYTEAVMDRFSWTALTPSGCDQPNALRGECDPGSRFQVLRQTPDATVVANCRKGNFTASATANQYADIAVIQYNKQNGALCFYQAYNVANGNAMPAPSTGTGPWLSPELTHSGGCTGCHDNGAFIKSRYLTQLDASTFPSKPNLIPSEAEGYVNKHLPLAYVGRDFVADRSWSIDTDKDASDTSGGENCNHCHRLAVNNVDSTTGTATHLAPMATSLTFTGTAGKAWKTAHGPTSPIWMRPGQVDYDPGAEATAGKFRDCANGYWGNNTEPGWTMGTPTAGCAFTELGVPFEPYADDQGFTDVNIGISGGTRTPNDMVQTLRAAGTDIFNNADQFLYSYKQLVGDGAATVKVTSLVDTNAFAKAGIMFRDGTSAGAVNTMVDITPSGAQFQYRNAVGGSTTSLPPLSNHAGSRWLKLARAGRTFVGYVSTDQAQWTQVGTPVTLPSDNFPPNTSAMVGLAATSHNSGTQTTATFDHFAWLPATPQTLLDANIGINNGSHTFRGGTHTILAGGTDIFGTADQFFYAFKAQSGAASIRAKVNSLIHTDQYAKA
ncbi:MAG TPA: hypothetical protein VJU61_05805, partial [Polyangiaceae bacterium]|nr:hypothetical protein [Polyangiaceae bacterium]